MRILKDDSVCENDIGASSDLVNPKRKSIPVTVTVGPDREVKAEGRGTGEWMDGRGGDGSGRPGVVEDHVAAVDGLEVVPLPEALVDLLLRPPLGDGGEPKVWRTVWPSGGVLFGWAPPSAKGSVMSRRTCRIPVS